MTTFVCVVVAALCFFLLWNHVSAMQLKVDDKNPMIAYGNGTKFDISTILNYPATTSGPGVRPSVYDYFYNPTGGVPCNDEGNAAICQHADFPRNCGTPENAIWLLQSQYPLRLHILYTNGISWRLTNMTFSADSSQEKTTFEFISENPFLHYNFVVSGKDVQNILQHLDQPSHNNSTRMGF
eukprot:m.5277 g.5277  ORF g.5277 m.5277 type:complete len:182 (+) comp2372_c0_seq1:46-591(+)